MDKKNVEKSVRDLMIRVVHPDIVFTEKTLYETMLIHQPRCFISLDNWEHVLAKILRDSSNAGNGNNMNTMFFCFRKRENSYGDYREYYLLNPDFPEWKEAHKAHSHQDAPESGPKRRRREANLITNMPLL